MKITTLSSAPKVPFDLEGYIMHKSNILEVIHICLQTGESIALHKNEFDVVVCLIKGEVTLLTNEKQVKLGLYCVAEIGKEAQRGFINHGTDEARLLILKKI